MLSCPCADQVKKAASNLHECLVARAALALASRLQGVHLLQANARPAAQPAKTAQGPEVQGACPLVHGYWCLVKALGPVAPDTAVRVCAPTVGEALETDSEDRVRVVTWLELVVLVFGTSLAPKLGALLLSAPARGVSHSHGVAAELTHRCLSADLIVSYARRNSLKALGYTPCPLSHRPILDILTGFSTPSS